MIGWFAGGTIQGSDWLAARARAVAGHAESMEEERKEIAESGRWRSAMAEEALVMGTNADSGGTGRRRRRRQRQRRWPRCAARGLGSCTRPPPSQE